MRRRLRGALGCLFLLGCLAGLPGCAAVVLTAGGLGASAGINHTLSGIAYKTFNNSIEDMYVATLVTLDQLDMAVTNEKETEEGWEILAEAADREIVIELERLTKRATRMRVVAHEGMIFFKDSATATEIIILTAENLAV